MDAALFLKTWCIYMAAFSCTLFLWHAYLKLFKNPIIEIGSKGFNLRLYLRSHALRHLGIIFGSWSVTFCRRVHQVVYTVLHCVFEAMSYWMDHFRSLLITTTAARTPFWITPSGTVAWARTRWHGSWFLGYCPPTRTMTMPFNALYTFRVIPTSCHGVFYLFDHVSYGASA